MMNIVVIGMMGEGKTTVIKRYMEGKRALAYDVQNEYRELADDTRKQRSRVSPVDMKYIDFVKLCRTKRNTVCIFEDATGFISGRLEDDFKQFLVEKRHTGNVSVLVFHSIVDVPPNVLRLCDIVILFKTKDEAHYVEKKYPSLLKYYYDLLKKPQYSYHLIKR
jgi:Shikimate kinase